MWVKEEEKEHRSLFRFLDWCMCVCVCCPYNSVPLHTVFRFSFSSTPHRPWVLVVVAMASPCIVCNLTPRCCLVTVRPGERPAALHGSCSHVDVFVCDVVWCCVWMSGFMNLFLCLYRWLWVWDGHHLTKIVLLFFSLTIVLCTHICLCVHM